MTPTDYYDGSVPIGLASVRPSHVSSLRNIPTTRWQPSDLGSPLIPLNRFITYRSLIEAYCRPSLTLRLLKTSGTDMLPTGASFHRWRLEYRQSSFNHITTGVAELYTTCLHIFSALMPCSCPLIFSIQVRHSPQGHLLRTLPRFSGIFLTCVHDARDTNVMRQYTPESDVMQIVVFANKCGADVMHCADKDACT